MTYVVVSLVKGSQKYFDNIIHVPDLLLIHLGCEDKDCFSRCIVHSAFGTEEASTAYCSVNAQLIFRAPNLRTAVMSMITEKIQLPSGEMCCIHKIHNISWQEGVCDFLGILEARMKLRCVRFTDVFRKYQQYWAIPSADLKLSPSIREALKCWHCEFGVNVTYKGAATCRCLLVPKAILNAEPVEHDGTYSILSLRPTPTHVFASPNQKEVFGVCQEEPIDLLSLMGNFQTAAELERFKSQILPALVDLNVNETWSGPLEFLTPKGRETFLCTYEKCKSSCLIATFKTCDLQNVQDASTATNLARFNSKLGCKEPLRRSTSFERRSTHG